VWVSRPRSRRCDRVVDRIFMAVPRRLRPAVMCCSLVAVAEKPGRFDDHVRRDRATATATGRAVQQLCDVVWCGMIVLASSALGNVPSRCRIRADTRASARQIVDRDDLDIGAGPRSEPSACGRSR
jgi:hypothetical protein